MPFDVSLIVSLLREELSKIGVVAVSVDVDVLDNAGEALVIHAVSDAFDGQTYLDREMRVRPAVARALNAANLPRASYVLELASSDEVEEPAEERPENTEEEDESRREERVNRKIWRDQQASIIRALEASRYSVEPLLNSSLLVASKAGLSTEKILIGFAQSPSASTVDLELRKGMTAARQSQKFQACYYVAPKQLARPFSNQSNAEWLVVTDTVGFLHSLNSSESLARQLVRHCEAEFSKLAPEHKGRVIEPTVLAGEVEQRPVSFFDFIKEWIARPEPSFLVLMAPAGHGKTTLTVELTHRLAQSFLDEKSAQVPLLVPFESVRRTVDFEALMHKRLDQLRGGAFGVFAELLKSDNAVLLVDGFDELADDAGAAVAENQVRSMKSLVSGKAKVILAGRAAFTHQFAGNQSVVERVRSLLGDVSVETLEILPFDRDQIADYVKSREGLLSRQRESVLEFAQASPDHEELCATPLFLRILCSLAAQNRLPNASEVVAGVDFLVDKVCEREQERQNLGIGVQEQVEFLGNIAAEGFGTGTGRVSEDDVRVFADAFAERSKESSDELVGRLMDHAFLNHAGEGRLAFIHPFIRDVVLGRYIKQEIPRMGITPGAVVSQRDLPEGTIQYLARDSKAQFQMAPSGWLSETGGITGQARRNLFRIVAAGARYRHPDAPRVWWETAWLSGKTVRGLDLSNLVLQSLSFSDIVLNGCRMEGVLLEDCDLLGTKFHACDLSFALLVDCRASQQTEFVAGVSSGISVRLAGQSLAVGSWNDLKKALLSDEDVSQSVPVGRNADKACTELLRELFTQLADVDGRFHRRRLDELRLHADDRSMQLAFEKVVLPMARSRFCETELVAGSKELVMLSKRWRTQVVEFLKNGQMTSRMREMLSKMAVRAARYL